MSQKNTYPIYSSQNYRIYPSQKTTKFVLYKNYKIDVHHKISTEFVRHQIHPHHKYVCHINCIGLIHEVTRFVCHKISRNLPTTNKAQNYLPQSITKFVCLKNYKIYRPQISQNFSLSQKKQNLSVSKLQNLLVRRT